MPAVVGRLQEGVYIGADDRPGQAYRLLLLDVQPGAGPDAVHDALRDVWGVLSDLRQGDVPDFARYARPGDPPPKKVTGALTCLLGFGKSLFAHDQPQIVVAGDPPAELMQLHPDRNANQPFPSLGWTALARSRGDADFAIQLIAETELAVSRAVVEVCSLIEKGTLPLKLVTFHGGFNRDDGRGWLNFHESLSNLSRAERRVAVEVVRKDPLWMQGGTYMAFLRLAVALDQWRELSREEQEALVGRDKLSGCPLASAPRGQAPVSLAGCPIPTDDPASPRHLDAGHTDDPVLEVSHIHRANPTRSDPSVEGSNRIYRQGYEFLELTGESQWRVGLNFVSFQRSLSHFTSILTKPGWMSTVNFGGRARRGERPPIQLASIIGAGYYAVPPAGGVPFPGADLFRAK